MKPKPRSIDEVDEYRGLPAFIVGNSITRRHLDMHQLRGKGLVVGCNRFGQDHDFSGYPSLLSASDPKTIELICRRKWYRKFDSFLMPSNRYAGQLDVPPEKVILGPGFRKNIPTGERAIQSVFTFGCHPIFLIGFGGGIEKVEGRDTNNMYELTDGPYAELRGHRTLTGHEIAHHQRIEGIWLDTIGLFDFKHPDTLYRVEDTGNLEFLPYVDWDKLLEAL